jgi:hypothetical protein
MSVVLFSGGDDKRECNEIAAVLEPVASKRSLEVFTNFEDFSVRIRRLPGDIDVAVLSVRNDYQLTALLSLSEYLFSTRIILILPEGSDCLLSKGHLLHPRFLTHSSGDFSDVAAVLSKMLRNGNTVHHEKTYLGSH